MGVFIGQKTCDLPKFDMSLIENSKKCVDGSFKRNKSPWVFLEFFDDSNPRVLVYAAPTFFLVVFCDVW